MMSRVFCKGDIWKSRSGLLWEVLAVDKQAWPTPIAVLVRVGSSKKKMQRHYHDNSGWSIVEEKVGTGELNELYNKMVTGG